MPPKKIKKTNNDNTSDKVINKNKLKIGNLDLNDPLDSNAKNDNFLTNEKYSVSFTELAEKWSSLPLYTNKKEMLEFFKSINENQVTLVISGTGSGKTVLIPKFLLKYFWETKTDNKTSTKIAVTNPKTLTTIYNAEYSAKTLDVELGSHVGYKFRGSPENMISDKSNLIYATDGLLLAGIKTDPLLKDYDGVIIDEAHERQVPIDLLLYFLKNVLKNRPEFKLIIMSATIDAEIFKNFYELDDIKFGKIDVSGKSNYPIESIFLKPNDKINLFNYMDLGISIILKLLDETDKGDILMFVTTQRETELGCSRLANICKNKVRITDVCNTYYCAEVYGKMSDENRTLAVEPDKYKTLNNDYKRKVIFATNVAESSITLDGILYVIDSGLELLSYFNYEKYSQIMEKRYTTHAQVKQRMGRAGRTQPGTCYHLYSENKFNSLIKYPSPTISLSNLNEHFLSFLKIQKYLTDTIKMATSLITPATTSQITSAIRYLHFYKLIKLIIPDENNQSGGENNCNGTHPIFGKDYSNFNYTLNIDKENIGDIKYFIDKEKGFNKNMKRLTRQNEYHDKYTIIFDKNSMDGDTQQIPDNIQINDKNNNVLFTDIPYNKIFTDLSLLDKYEGTTTTFGNIIYDMAGYPIELCMLAFYGKLMGISSLYSIASLIAAMDNKIDNLINFPPNTSNKIEFINNNFGNAITYLYSEHIFILNLLTNYYDLENNIELLNKNTFEKANDIKNTFIKTLDKINDNKMEKINKKYNLVSEEINNLDVIDKIYIAIYMSYRYNKIKLIDNQNKPIYQTQNYFDNTSLSVSFPYGNQINSEDADNYSIGICSGLSVLGNKTFVNGITLFPESLIRYIN